MGWRGTQNGALLALAAKEFDVLVTVDKNIAFQQNPEKLPIPVVVLHGASTRLEDLRALVTGLKSCLPTIKRGELHHITRSDERAE